MKRNHRSTQRRRLRSPLERLSSRLEELAGRDSPSAYQERLEQLGRAMFGDLWEPRPASGQKSGTCPAQPDYSV